MLDLPAEAFQAQGESSAQHPAAAAASMKPRTEHCSVQRLAAFDCAAPIHEAFAFEEPAG